MVFGSVESLVVGHAPWGALDGEETGGPLFRTGPMSFDRLNALPKGSVYLAIS